MKTLIAILALFLSGSLLAMTASERMDKAVKRFRIVSHELDRKESEIAKLKEKIRVHRYNYVEDQKRQYRWDNEKLNKLQSELSGTMKIRFNKREKLRKKIAELQSLLDIQFKALHPHILQQEEMNQEFARREHTAKAFREYVSMIRDEMNKAKDTWKREEQEKIDKSIAAIDQAVQEHSAESNIRARQKYDQSVQRSLAAADALIKQQGFKSKKQQFDENIKRTEEMSNILLNQHSILQSPTKECDAKLGQSPE